jgi:hypothetical protein
MDPPPDAFVVKLAGTVIELDVCFSSASPELERRIVIDRAVVLDTDASLSDIARRARLADTLSWPTSRAGGSERDSGVARSPDADLHGSHTDR